MNVFQQVVQLRKLAKELKELLPTLEDKASFYYNDPDLHDAWLIVETQYEIISGIVTTMEAIFDAPDTQN